MQAAQAGVCCIQVHDIDELKAASTRKKACPYYMAKAIANSEDAELVVCPYNYIIDPLIRKYFQIDLSGAIVIFDEAHNIEDVARDAASVDITLDEVRAALRDAEEALKDLGHKLEPPDKMLERGDEEFEQKHFNTLFEEIDDEWLEEDDEESDFLSGFQFLRYALLRLQRWLVRFSGSSDDEQPWIPFRYKGEQKLWSGGEVRC